MAQKILEMSLMEPPSNHGYCQREQAARRVRPGTPPAPRPSLREGDERDEDIELRVLGDLEVHRVERILRDRGDARVLAPAFLGELGPRERELLPRARERHAGPEGVVALVVRGRGRVALP